MRMKQTAGGALRIATGFGVLAILFSAVLIFGYNPFQDNLGTVTAPNPVVPRWAAMPVVWLLNATTPSNNVTNTGCSSSLATCIQQSLTNGFTAWTNAQIPIGSTPQALTYLTVHYAGSSTLTSPDAADCQNALGFSDTNTSDFSTGTIAFTQVATFTPQGGVNAYSCSGGATKTCPLADCIADADIEFNPNVNFSTSTSPPSGTFSL